MSALKDLSEEEFLRQFKETPVHEIEFDGKLTYSGLIVKCQLRKTRKDAMRVVQQNGLLINGEVQAEDKLIGSEW